MWALKPDSAGRFLRSTALVSVLLAGLPQAASAVVLFENAWTGALGAACNFQCDLTPTIGAENFVLGDASVLTGLAFESWTLNTTDHTGINVDWSIWSDVGGDPGSALHSGNAAPTFTTLEAVAGIYLRTRYEFSVPDISLAAGTYWAGFHVNLPNDTGNRIFWARTTEGDDDTDRSVDGGLTWTGGYSGASVGASMGMVFAVSGRLATTGGGGDVPEPAGAALLGLAFVGVAAARRRRR